MQTPGDERYPALSPDGTRLVYRSDVDGDPEIYVARADGSEPRQLTSNALFDSAPAWSPDGSRIAFERGDPGADVRSNASYGSMELWTMSSDGGDERQITTNAVHDEGPAWAPDGSGALVFTRDDGSNSDLWILDSGGGERRVTDLPSLEESPDWQALPGPAPAPASGAPLAKPTPADRVVSRRVRVSRTGRLVVRVRCDAPCAGTLTLVRERKRLARARFRAVAGQTISVRLRVGPRTLRRLRRAGALRVAVRGVGGAVTLLRPR